MTIVAEDAVGAVADEVHVAASRSTPLYNRDDTPHTDRRAARTVHSGGRKFVHPNWTPQGILCSCVVLCCVVCIVITVVIKASAEDHSSWILDETTVSGSHRKTTVREFCMNRSCGSGRAHSLWYAHHPHWDHDCGFG